MTILALRAQKLGQAYSNAIVPALSVTRQGGETFCGRRTRTEMGRESSAVQAPYSTGANAFHSAKGMLWNPNGPAAGCGQAPPAPGEGEQPAISEAEVNSGGGESG